MLTASVILYVLISLGLLGVGAKYAFGPAPAPHHEAALHADGVTTKSMMIVLRAVYIPMAAACAAVAFLLVVLALGPIADGDSWASAVATSAALILGVPTSISSWRFEHLTGVRGPYRIVVVLTALSVLALALTLF
ncbi:hypothetical protein [Fulvimarina sp. MAC3]|uniref:hypothetical protein n=1 Tax=Fulvimarina sp. MAC3 TaxID=3148887 RepID=UPI0031FD6EB3